MRRIPVDSKHEERDFNDDWRRPWVIYKEDETLILAGDFNAATAVAADEQDGVMGPHGVAKG
jgi:hypothetical protein